MELLFQQIKSVYAIGIPGYYYYLVSQLLHVGNTIFLNAVNRNNPFFGKVSDMGSSGHWR